MQEHSDENPPTPSEAFLSALVGRPIVVHTITGGGEAPARFGAAQAATIYGRLDANYPDALLLDTSVQGQPGGSVFVYKRALVAVEARGAPTP